VNNQAVLDRSFAALAHPARRAILARLARGPSTVGEATAGLEISKPAVSKHLRVLEDAGLVARSVHGRTHRLRLEDRPLAEASRWLERHRSLWNAKFDAVERRLAGDE
jgi:DNA-binding transcriptional ArsR family regulator